VVSRLVSFRLSGVRQSRIVNDLRSSCRVLQEATTNNTTFTCCGNWALGSWLPFLWIERLARRVAEHYENRPSWIIGDPPINRMVYLSKARYGNLPGKLTLLDVLGACRGLGASNPRDHVYAARNMVEDRRIPELKPNHSLSVSEVFIDSTEWLFNAGESALDVLGYVEARTKDLPQLLNTQDGLVEHSAGMARTLTQP